MSENQLTCPKCGNKIEIAQAISHEIEERIKNEYEKEMVEKIAKIKEDSFKKAQKELLLDLKEKDDELHSLEEKLNNFRKKEKQILQMQKEIEEQKYSMQVEYQERLIKETKKIYDDAKNKTDEENKLRMLEYEKTIRDLKNQMIDAQKKAEQGSMQLQGEVQELELEDQLKRYFSDDEIIPVKTGQKGGDIIQIVRTRNNGVVGKIIWESKRTKNWSNSWLDKIKEDQRCAQAEIAIIISEVLPQEIKNFGLIDNIWIGELKYAIGLATAMRENLKALNQLKHVNTNKNDKMELIYNYLTGTQFKQRVEAILESFIEMKNDLDVEKRAYEKIWSKREKQIEKFVRNMSGMYGDLQGYGATLPNIKILELPNC